MTIKIVLPESEGVRTCIGTKIFNDEGCEITNIERIRLDLNPDSFITAVVDVCVSSIDNMDNIHALLGTETLEQIADLHGFKLVKI
jgi:hypothetical protein